MRPRSAKLAIALSLVAVAAVSPALPADCTGASPDAAVTPPAQSIVGFPNRQARSGEINHYVALVGRQSHRVRSGVLARSWKGNALSYALVSSEENMRRVDKIAADQQRLRDPRVTTATEAEELAAKLPAIVWYTGNVHGNETSGADAAVEILYRLASGNDCAALEILNNLVVGILPMQNPDGRDAVSRENAYGFDMNRDWFVATQPETSGKLDLLVRYPPVLYIDAHEQGSSNFFFPPNADPIHHEISSESVHWINDLYGPALAAEFDRRRASDPTQWNYFNYDVYDLFYMGYGDTVPTTAFTAAGMTFEKGTVDTDRQRETEQFTAGWTALQTAATHRVAILTDYYRAHRSALEEGGRGKLEPNQVFERGKTLRQKVPATSIRHYFIDPTRADTDATRLVARLMRMGVEVYRLDSEIRIPDLRLMGRTPAAARMPAGSYWIPMAQPQKRWIQALLGEDSYVPFPYFYDVTSWSNPLLMNLRAGASASRLAPKATRLREPPRGEVDDPSAPYFWFQGSTASDVAAAFQLAREGRAIRRLSRPTTVAGSLLPSGAFVVPDVAADSIGKVARRFGVRVRGGRGTPPSGVPVRAPKIALFSPVTQLVARAVNLEESFGHMRWLLEQAWNLPITILDGVQVASGALTSGKYDVFIVPGVTTDDLSLARSEISSWISAGGIYVGTARPGGTGGTPFAVSSGFTTASLSQPAGLEVPGSQFRVQLTANGPLSLGAGPFAYWYQLGEDALSPTKTGRNVGVYPSSAPDFWISGYSNGAEALRGSAALVEETLGSGRVVLFSGEPNYRGFTDGSAFLLVNALAYPTTAAPAGTDIASAVARPQVLAAMASAHPAFGPGRPIQIEVAARDAAAAGRVLSRFTPAAQVEIARGSAWFTIPNPYGWTREEHPFTWRLLPALKSAGVVVRSAVL